MNGPENLPHLDPDFIISGEQRAAVLDVINGNLPKALGDAMVAGVMAGLTMPEAGTLIVWTLLNAASRLAVSVRRDMLHGEPDLERWRGVTEFIWHQAVNATPEEGEEAGG